MKRVISVNNLMHKTTPIAKEDKDDEISINIEKEIIIDWNNKNLFNNLPENEYGVYVIYDYNNNPLYVGKTWGSKGFKGRFRAHRMDEQGYFPYWELVGHKVRLYCLKNRLQILTLEAIKIQQHEPPFNKEDFDKGDAVLTFEKNKIKELLHDAMVAIKMFYIPENEEDEFEIKLNIIRQGYNTIMKKIEEELEKPFSFRRWLQKEANEYISLDSHSKHYIKGLAELIREDT